MNILSIFYHWLNLILPIRNDDTVLVLYIYRTSLYYIMRYGMVWYMADNNAIDMPVTISISMTVYIWRYISSQQYQLEKLYIHFIHLNKFHNICVRVQYVPLQSSRQPPAYFTQSQPNVSDSIDSDIHRGARDDDIMCWSGWQIEW